MRETRKIRDQRNDKTNELGGKAKVKKGDNPPSPNFIQNYLALKMTI